MDDKLVLQELNHIRDTLSTVNDRTISTDTKVTKLCVDMAEQKTKYEPVYQQHLFRKQKKKENSEALKKWGLIMGICAAVVTAGSFLQWG